MTTQDLLSLNNQDVNIFATFAVIPKMTATQFAPFVKNTIQFTARSSRAGIAKSPSTKREKTFYDLIRMNFKIMIEFE